MRRGQRLAAVMAACVTGIATVAMPSATQAAPPPSAVVATAQPARTVTLITGDRVTLTARGDASIQRAEGRARVPFLTRQLRGHLYAIPADAMPLLRADRLDARLFDITQLVAWGYDDRRADLPLIVTDNAQLGAAATGTVGAGRPLPSVNGAAVRVARSGDFWKSLTGPPASALSGGKTKVWLDGVRTPTLDVSVPLIGAPTAWQAGYTGVGVPVAVLDTGVDATHPDLAGRVAAQANFTEGEEDDRDLVGHGTHVASTVAGSGAASAGRYKGVAPDARLLSGKVCVRGGCAESWILAGMEWATAQQHAKVVNLSLGGTDTPELDPVERAVQTLTAQHGTLFVVAAGNEGANATVGSPASADAALAVAAFTKSDGLADFSSRGPRVGDGALKPDLAAPGVDITAANGKDGFLGSPGEPYLTLSGTSMATPHVAGGAAILAQRHPDWSPAQLKAALMASARPNPTVGVFAQGAGRVDVARAVDTTLLAAPPSLSFGRALWPHQDDVPVTRTITYQNAGSAAVTLRLAVHATGPDGRPAPDGMFTLSAGEVVVAPGATGSVTVTADPRTGGVDGAFTGQLTASVGDAVLLRTPLAIDRETEHYDVTIAHGGRDGKPTDSYFTDLIGMDTLDFLSPYDPDGTVTLRLPKGRFMVATTVFDLSKDPAGITTLAMPVLDVSAPRTITMDARLGRPVTITVPRAGAKPADVSIQMAAKGSEFWRSTGFGFDQLDNVYIAQVGDDDETGSFLAKVGSQWTDGTDHSPYAYLLAWYERGRMPTGFTRRVAERDLGTVRAEHRAHAGPLADAAYFSHLPGVDVSSSAAGLRLRVPQARVEHYNTDDGVRWAKLFAELVQRPDAPFPLPVSFTQSQATAYRPGRHVDEVWNQGVYGPCFPIREVPEQWVTRRGDTLLSRAPVLCDSAGHLGFAEFTSARTTLWRDGEKLGEEASAGFGDFTLPASQGRYRLEVELTRGSPFTLATRSTTAWTFSSAHVEGNRPLPLPLSALRILPPLDGANAVPGGSTFPVPVNVERQPDSGARASRELTLEVSYDDGRTWRRVPLVRLLGGGVGLVTHPDLDGFASVRARSTDFAGNTVEQTIIRAYKITPR